MNRLHNRQGISNDMILLEKRMFFDRGYQNTKKIHRGSITVFDWHTHKHALLKMVM
jgi:hypothetical protein